MLLFASRKTHGNQSRADVLSSDILYNLPPMFYFFAEKKLYIPSATLTGASQTNFILPSQCQNLGKVSKGEMEKKEVKKK